MSSVNKAILIGNIGKDPEIRTMQNGNRIASFSLATSEKWKDKESGERKEKTEWHKVVVFNSGIIGFVEKYLRKGSKVYVEGAIESRKWIDGDGKDRYQTEIVLRQYDGEIVILDMGNPENSSEREQKKTLHHNPKPVDDEIPFNHAAR